MNDSALEFTRYNTRTDVESNHSSCSNFSLGDLMASSNTRFDECWQPTRKTTAILVKHEQRLPSPSTSCCCCKNCCQGCACGCLNSTSACPSRSHEPLVSGNDHVESLEARIKQLEEQLRERDDTIRLLRLEKTEVATENTPESMRTHSCDWNQQGQPELCRKQQQQQQQQNQPCGGQSKERLVNRTSQCKLLESIIHGSARDHMCTSKESHADGLANTDDSNASISISIGNGDADGDDDDDNQSNCSMDTILDAIQKWVLLKGGKLPTVESLISDYCKMARSPTASSCANTSEVDSSNDDADDGMIPVDRMFIAGMLLHPQSSAYAWKWEHREKDANHNGNDNDNNNNDNNNDANDSSNTNNDYDWEEFEIPRQFFFAPNYDPNEPFATLMERRAKQFRMKIIPASHTTTTTTTTNAKTKTGTNADANVSPAAPNTLKIITRDDMEWDYDPSTTKSTTNANKDGSERSCPPGCSWFIDGGFQDYLALPILHKGEFNGAIAWCTKRRGGFTKSHIRRIHESLNALQMVLQLHTHDIIQHTLTTYLEDEVRDRTKELAQANERLEEANQRVKQQAQLQLAHFAMMSHEIRTPLNCIVGLSNVLLELWQEEKERHNNSISTGAHCYAENEKLPDSYGNNNARLEQHFSSSTESMQMIAQSGDLLLAIVNDVLDYSKLAAGKVELVVAPTSVVEVVQVVLESIRIKASQQSEERRSDERSGPLRIVSNLDSLSHVHRQCTTDQDSDCQELASMLVEMDGRRLQQILYNLLGNAIKFGRDGDRVEFHVSTGDGNINSVVDENCDDSSDCGTPIKSVLSRSSLHSLHVTESEDIATSSQTNQGLSKDADRFIQFSVKDFGPGISEENREHIFQPFQQAHSDSFVTQSRSHAVIDPGYGGTGLGLAITSRLVHRLNGTIHVESEVGKWTEFIVRLPLVDVTSSQESNPEHQACDAMAKNHVAAATTAAGIVDDTYDSDPGFDMAHLRRSFMQLPTESAFGNDFSSSISSMRYHIVEMESKLMKDQTALQTELPSTRTMTTATTLTMNASAHDIDRSEKHEASFSHLSLAPDFKPNPVHDRTLQHCASTTNIATNRSRSRSRSIQDVRVLVAEDNRINQKVLIKSLQRVGVQSIDLANDGVEAVDLSEREHYDVIFMDMQMPVMDGLEATTIIKARASAQTEKTSADQHTQAQPACPKIIFLTAHALNEFKDKAEQAGGDGFIPKPFKLAEIRKLFDDDGWEGIE